MAISAYLRGWKGWALIVPALLAVLGAAGVVESLLCRVVLTPTALEIWSWGRCRRYPKGDIAGVTVEKGAPVALKMVDGTGKNLPELGRNTLGLANSIRAWQNADE
jgi:hypothetical protein